MGAQRLRNLSHSVEDFYPSGKESLALEMTRGQELTHEISNSRSKSPPTVYASRSIITPFTDRLLRAVRSSQMHLAVKE